MTNGSSDEGEEEHYYDAVAPTNNNNTARPHQHQQYKHVISHPGQQNLQGTLDMRNPSSSNSKKRRRDDDDNDDGGGGGDGISPQTPDENGTTTSASGAGGGATEPEKKQRKKADHTGGPWTSEQDAYLERLIKEGHKVLQIQNMFEDRFHLGRSRDAVRNRVKRVRAKTMELSSAEERLIKEEIRFVQDPNNLSRIVLDRVKLLVPNATQGLIERYMKDDKDVQLAVALDGFKRGKISRTMKAHMKMVMGEETGGGQGQGQSPSKGKKQQQPNAVPLSSIQPAAGEGPPS